MSLAEFELSKVDSTIKITGTEYNTKNLNNLSSLISEIENDKTIKSIEFFGNFNSSLILKLIKSMS